MKNTIIRLTEIRQLSGKKYKTLVYNDESFMLSTKMHKTMDTMMQSTQKSGLMESVKTIPINSIKKLEYNENDISINMKYQDKNKLKAIIIALKQKDMKQSISEEVATMQNLSKSTKTEPKIRLLITKLLVVIVIGLFFGYVRNKAISGETADYNGRYSGLISIIESLGPEGWTVLGGAVAIYILFIAIKRFMKPAQNVTFS